MLGVNYCLLGFHTFICYVLEFFQDLAMRKTFNKQKAYTSLDEVLLTVTLKQVFILHVRKSMLRLLKFAEIN